MDSKHQGRDPRGNIPKLRLGELYNALPHGRKAVFAKALHTTTRTVTNWIHGKTYMDDAQVVRAAAWFNSNTESDVCAFDLLDYYMERSKETGAVSDIEGKTLGEERYKTLENYAEPLRRCSMFKKRFTTMELHTRAVATWEHINDPNTALLSIHKETFVTAINGVFDPLLWFMERLPFTHTLRWEQERDGTKMPFYSPLYDGGAFSNPFKHRGLGDEAGHFVYDGPPDKHKESLAIVWESRETYVKEAFSKIDPEEYRQAMREAFQAVPTDFRDLTGIARAVGEVGAELDNPVRFIVGAGALLDPEKTF